MTLRYCLLALFLSLLSATAAAAGQPRVGLVLGGGGARGAAHIGVLEVLAEQRVPIACIAGTSMGGLVAGAWAAGLTPARMQGALEKRPVSVERLEEAIAHIKQKLRATGEREIKSLVLGELVMTELQKLDEVAYIRFASVYRRFQDLNEFREEIDRLAREPVKP